MATRRGTLGYRAVALALLTASAGAQALPLDYGEVSGSFDTTLSAGVSLRMQDRDPGQVAIANGGTARTANEDDGNLNYDKGQVISAAVKATHDLSLQYQDYGVFSRATYFYDPVTSGRDTCPGGSVQQQDCLGPQAHDRLDWDFRLLDLFGYGKFNVAGYTVNARIGRQVINWGESTFIGNSLNSINPVDVSKLRTPGAELKEALLPSPIVWGNVVLNDEVSVEALWIAGYDNTKIDPRGSFFSTNDTLSDDGDRVTVSFGRRNDQHQPFAPPATVAPDGTVTPNPSAQVWLPRSFDRDPHSTRGQYGAAVRYLSSALSDTELGFYYLRYHSRTPLFSTTRGSASSLAGAGTANYFAEFPENINLFGVSFNTSAPGGLALQGEASYRPNQPLQLSGTEVVMASLGLANNVTSTDAATAAAVPVGTEITGYRDVKMAQLQSTATKAFGPTLGAEQFAVVGEVGFNYLWLPTGLVFSGPGAVLPAPGSANAAGGSFQDGGYATRFSWGYRVSARMDFESVFDALQLSPRLVFAHDVTGVGPNFNQDTKAVTAGLTANYLQKWSADISYALFSGGRDFAGTDTAPPPPGQSASYSTSANPNRDRDFLSLSISYAF